MTHKVVFVGGKPCEFCRATMENYAGLWRDSNLVLGRVYTVASAKKTVFPLNSAIRTIAYTLVEAPLEGSWRHCCCEFRDVEGDADAWKRVVSRHRPKTKELEPA